MPQVSLSKLPGLGPGAHLSGAAPVLAPSCNPSCLLSKTPSHPELKAKSLWKEFMTNRVIPLMQALFYLPHVNYREPPGNHSPVHGHHVLFRKHNQSFNWSEKCKVSSAQPLGYSSEATRSLRGASLCLLGKFRSSEDPLWVVHTFRETYSLVTASGPVLICSCLLGPISLLFLHRKLEIALVQSFANKNDKTHHQGLDLFLLAFSPSLHIIRPLSGISIHTWHFAQSFNDPPTRYQNKFGNSQ